MKVIEFMGMPKAGKSTQLEYVESVLKHKKGARVRVVYEGARVCPLDKSERFMHNAWSFHNTTNRIMEARENSFDYMLVDRGVYDHIAFTYALHHSKEITIDQCDEQEQYFRHFGFLEESVLAFMIDPEEAMKRELKHHQISGRVMNPDFLKILHSSYQNLLEECELGEIVPAKVQVIDGSKPIKENMEEVLSFVLAD